MLYCLYIADNKLYEADFEPEHINDLINDLEDIKDGSKQVLPRRATRVGSKRTKVGTSQEGRVESVK